jgi:hypothetical protein
MPGPNLQVALSDYSQILSTAKYLYGLKLGRMANTEMVTALMFYVEGRMHDLE